MLLLILDTLMNHFFSPDAVSTVGEGAILLWPGVFS